MKPHTLCRSIYYFLCPLSNTLSPTHTEYQAENKSFTHEKGVPKVQFYTNAEREEHKWSSQEHTVTDTKQHSGSLLAVWHGALYRCS